MGLDVAICSFEEKLFNTEAIDVQEPNYTKKVKEKFKTGPVLIEHPILFNFHKHEIHWSKNWVFLDYLRVRFGVYSDETYFVGQIKDVYNIVRNDIKRLNKNKCLLPLPKYFVYGFDSHREEFENNLLQDWSSPLIWQDLTTLHEVLSGKMKKDRYQLVTMGYTS